MFYRLVKLTILRHHSLYFNPNEELFDFELSEQFLNYEFITKEIDQHNRK